MKQVLKEPLHIHREICERSLYEFIRHFWRYMDPSAYVDGWHIRAICEHLEAITNGELRRLIINIPPRHMKSLSVAVAWPAWTWAQERKGRYLAGPQVRFLSASYAYSLAVRDNRKCRMLIEGDLYRKYWGDRVILASDQNAKGRFENTEKGYRLCTSVEGTATGEGGDINIVDDPLNAKEKEQEVARNAVIDWWTQVMPTRLNDKKRGAYVIIMQRLHHQDLTGHILEHETGWTHLCLPAKYEEDHPHVYTLDPRKVDGELLWPAHIGQKEIDELEETMGSYGAAGQLQQRPSPREGGMFRAEWFDVVEEAPAQATRVRGWDFAGSTKKTSPWSVGIRMSKSGRTFYIESVIRFRGTPKDLDDAFKNTAAQDGKSCTIDFPQDPGQAGKHQRQYLAGLVPEYNVRSSPETGSKVTRAEPLSAQAEAGNVKLVRGHWNRAFLDEVTVFPNSDYKDQVDAASRAFARLARKRSNIGGGSVIF